MQKQGLLRASAFAIVLTLFLLPGIAHANNVVVSCPGQSLSAAVAALPPGPNTVTVTGTCMNENVVINNMRSLTIVGVGGAKIVQAQDSDTFDISLSQDINLQNLEIAGIPGSSLGSGGAGLGISEASDVHITNCNIHDNEGGGIFETTGSILFLRFTTIQNNTPFSDGIDVIGNSTADFFGTTIQNNGSAAAVPGTVGVFAGSNSILRFRQNNLIQNNPTIGIEAMNLSTVVIGGGPANSTTTIQGNSINGILIHEGSHLHIANRTLIQGNGEACPPVTTCGGILATTNSTLVLTAGTISSNHGAGISVQQGSNLQLTGASISNNSADGVDIQSISILGFHSGNAITGNGEASISCDQRSLVIGNLTGISKIKCGQTVLQ